MINKKEQQRFVDIITNEDPDNFDVRREAWGLYAVNRGFPFADQFDRPLRVMLAELLPEVLSSDEDVCGEKWNVVAELVLPDLIRPYSTYLNWVDRLSLVQPEMHKAQPYLRRMLRDLNVMEALEEGGYTGPILPRRLPA